VNPFSHFASALQPVRQEEEFDLRFLNIFRFPSKSADFCLRFPFTRLYRKNVHGEWNRESGEDEDEGEDFAEWAADQISSFAQKLRRTGAVCG
jgi:hypothetical protein